MLQFNALPGERRLFSLVSPVRPRYFPLLPEGLESIRLLDLKVTFSPPSLWSGYRDWVSFSSASVVTNPVPWEKCLESDRNNTVIKEKRESNYFVLNRRKGGTQYFYLILFLEAKLTRFHYAEPISSLLQWDLSLHTVNHPPGQGGKTRERENRTAPDSPKKFLL